MMITLQLLPFVLVAVIAAFAVLNRCYDDNLLQRIGLSLICIGASVQVSDVLKIQNLNNNACLLLAYGLAIFGIGTIVKFKRLHRK